MAVVEVDELEPPVWVPVAVVLADSVVLATAASLVHVSFEGTV